MIIVAENKNEHYIMKNFLSEVYNASLNESDDDDINFKHAGEWPVLNQDDIESREIYTKDRPVSLDQLNKSAKSKPKMRNLANLVKKGLTVSLLAASTYFAYDMYDNKVVKDIARDNGIPTEKVIEISPDIVDDFDDFYDPGPTLTDDETNIDLARQEREYDGEGITQATHPNSVYNFEGFRSEPYPDAGGESIGFGIQLFSDINNKGGRTWQEVFFGDKLGRDIQLNDRGQQVIQRNGQTVKLNSIQSITREEAREATSLHMPHAISRMHTKYAWSRYLPRDAQLALLDMIYNMGPSFKMKGVRKNMKAASDAIRQGNFEFAIKYLETAKKEVVYQKTKEQMDYEGENPKNARLSAYAVQGEKSVPETGNNIHRRPINTLKRIDNAIEILKSKIQTESYSIKSIYNKLFS